MQKLFSMLALLLGHADTVNVKVTAAYELWSALYEGLQKLRGNVPAVQSAPVAAPVVEVPGYAAPAPLSSEPREDPGYTADAYELSQPAQ